MKNQSNKGIFRNLSLKIVSLLIAASLWLVVTNFNDPSTVLQVTDVQVRLLHTNLITDEGKVYSVLNDSDTIPLVTVTAPRSVRDTLRADNIVATADIANMTEDGQVPIAVTTNVNADKLTSITASNRFVSLSIEDSSTSTFNLEIETTGDPAEGYILDEVSPEQNQVRVTGPSSLVSAIDRAAIRVDTDGATGSISTYADILLYDANGAEIPTDDNLRMNLYSVKVRVEILATREVPVNFEIGGSPAYGYVLTGEDSVAPRTVMLAGRPSALSGVTQILIPASEVDVSGMAHSLTRTISLAGFLPEGTEFADSAFDGKVVVRVGIEEE